jgi:adenylate cyclase
LAREAARLGKDDAFCLCWAGFTLALVAKDMAEATELMDRALALNPNLARAWNLSGWLRVWLEQPEIAIEHFARAMRLSPLDLAFHAMENGTACAHFRAGRYGDALRWEERAVRRQPHARGALAMLATIRAADGDLEGARNAMSRALQIDPAMRIAALQNDVMFFSPNTPSRNAMFADLWRKVGLPE